MSIIRDITDFIFIEDKPEKADIIFVPGGSRPEPCEPAAGLFRAKIAPLVLPSGKYGYKLGRFPGTRSKKELYGGEFPTEWEYMKYVLMKNGVQENAILREDNATTTYDNAFLSKKVTDGLNIKIERAIVCCKSYHARRCLMFYSWAYPDARIQICPADIEGAAADDWYKNEFGTERVMSELRKCGEYFVNAIPDYVRD